MEKKPLVIEMLVSEDNDTGVEIISFVENPAIEIDFMFFGKETKREFKTTSSEKRIVCGAAMIPNEKIIRLDGNNNEYFVFFSEDTIRLCNEMYFKNGNNKGANLEHDVAVDGVTVVESWLIEDEKVDKAVALGFKDLPKGTWMISYKVDNDDVWEKIKSGEVLGFSVEGLFGQKRAEMSKEFTVDDLKEILNSNISDDEKLKAIRKKNETK
jgi:hypothetical protein